ncbi:hypothetical protein [Candidatus Ichthyocystis sparus]|uniref:hypothetical protein n=1 Tax=Candidatus Ichthyocystis sparus TaxID=1561004 RepID=UPI000B880BA8|nr:hypothetical protein [Candidatus Ichthyocystis sparus]
MNPVAGIGGASSGTGGDDGADQVGSYGLQQARTLLDGGWGVDIVSTIATVSATATVSSFVNTVDAASTSAATSVGKGGSGDRTKKGKGPAPKRSYTAGVVVSTAAVHPIPTGANVLPEVFSITSFQTMECCGFCVYAPDLLALRGMENDFLRTAEEVAISIFRSRVRESTFLPGALEERDICSLRSELFAAFEADMSDSTLVYFENVYRRVISSLHLVDGERMRFSSEEADNFSGLFFASTVTRVRECLVPIWNAEISRALGGIRSATTDTATTAAASSTSLLLPSSSFPVPGFVGLVDLFGFEVSPDFSGVVNRLIFEVGALAKCIYPYMVKSPVSGVLRKLSDSERRAWCADNMMFYETNFLARCLAVYYAKLLPDFINPLCSVRVWDSSSHSLLPLTGNRLGDFWVSLYKAILKVLGSFFVARWSALTRRFFVPLGPEEGLFAPCGGDFVSAHAKSGVPSLSVPRSGSIIGRMKVRVVPYGDDGYVDLFGFKVLPEVREIVDVLICDVGALARNIYLSVVRIQVLDALSKLSDSEQCAWLIANMMLYKTALVAKCFAGYRAEFRLGFIDSFFGVGARDTFGRDLLSLSGNDLIIFWTFLGRSIIGAAEDVFSSEWSKFTNRFFAPLSPEESAFSVLRGEDFVNAYAKVGVPALAISGGGSMIRERRAQAVSRIAEVDGGSSVAGGNSESRLRPQLATVDTSSSASEILGSELLASSSGLVTVVATSVPSVTTSVGVGELDMAAGSSGGTDYSLGLKKSFMIRLRAIGEPFSSGMSSSSVSASSDVAAGLLSSAPAVMGSVPSVSTTTAYAYSGDEDIGVKLAALMNSSLPPSPSSASKLTPPTEGEASSSSRGSGGGKRKREN